MKIERLLENKILKEDGVDQELKDFKFLDHDDLDGWNSVMNIVASYCKPWFDVISNGSVESYFYNEPFYRGSEDSRHVFFRPIRKDRRPLETIEKVHHEFNDYLEEMGAVAHRGNSIFITRSRNIANAYGNIFYVFPVGQFNYTWIDNLTDFTLSFRSILRNHTDKFMDTLDPDSYEDDYNAYTSAMSDMIERVKNNIHIDEGINKVKRQEVMVKAEGAIYINAKEFNYGVFR